MEMTSYEQGVPSWVDLTTSDLSKALEFYGELLGWESEAGPPEAGGYRVMHLRGKTVAGIGPQMSPQAPTAWATYVNVDSADAAAERVREAGGRVLAEPMDVAEAGRMAVFADPEGAEFRVWQAGGNRGARVVNEHGSLNFNTLAVRDLDRGKAFYGAVFGWQTLELPGGSMMWTLPGYGDELEKASPGLRAGMAEMGAPAGFEDVVAALMPLADGEAPSWGVTFAVDDADVIAADAEKLGGRVLMAPFDAPWVRMTVISDPQGATFTASKFVPENRGMESRTGEPAAAA
jgi:predicted enzyme related to lactoylglutathione lyase